MADLRDQFQSSGRLAELLEDFQPRPGQLKLARRIAECLDSGTDLVAEAATGTGKTLAYLLPVLASKGKAIISTGTLNLQDQLFRRDLPLALKATGSERSVALLKGRANYLCPQRMERADDGPAALDDETLSHLDQVRRWARHTIGGEIRELEGIAERARIWPLVTSTIDNCLGAECPRLNDCHVLKARRQAQDADIVVVNHHLLFADLALKQSGFGEVLPGADAIIVDEAHQIPDVATRFFSHSVSAWQVGELARDTLAATATAAGSVKLLRAPIEALKESLTQLASRAHNLPERGDWQRLRPLNAELDTLHNALANLAAVTEPVQSQSREMAGCHDRARALASTMDMLLAGSEAGVRWFTCRRGRLSLTLTPLDIAEPFGRLRGELPSTWIMTSATLAVNGDFGHFTRRLGLENPATEIIESPFDYPRQTRLWLPDKLPEPNDPAHTETLLERVHPLLRASRGRAFLLFTSHRALQRAAAWLRANTDFRLLVQEDAPRDVLLQEFRARPGSLLLGAASFWEGVDVRGEALSVVVIDKLPFSSPDDPVLSATIRATRERGGNPFAEMQIPAAVLALKQGAGRLIRHAQDRGVLVLGDPRITGRGYGRIFINSLPPMPRCQDVQQAIDFLGEAS
ncbi:MAG: ATP-dependent DNA helicase [Wenzhouxiangellaceae bacterium]|nr:ATP-dependent DNA helicase [Wenzhouxiangellaceae bacterium]